MSFDQLISCNASYFTIYTGSQECTKTILLCKVFTYRVSVNLLVYNCVTLSLWAAYGFLQSVTPWTNLQIHAFPPLWTYQDILPPPLPRWQKFPLGVGYQKSCFSIFFLSTVVYNCACVTLGCLWFFLI